MNDPAREETIIASGAGLAGYWRDLWRYRELLAFFAWRDLLVRYKQTVFGVAWSVLRPLLTMVVFTLIFGTLAGFPSEGVGYPVLVYAAMLPWNLFGNTLTESGNAVVANANLISRIYFPRMILLGGAVVVSLVDFLISLGVLALLMGWYRVVPGWQIVTLPFFLLLALIASVGIGLWLSALNVRYRDFRYVVPFLVQFGLYISPVGFSSRVVPGKWRLLYSLNPLVGVIDGFRWALLGGEAQFFWPGFILSVVLSLIVFAFGLRYFRRTERTFADVV